MTPAKVIQIRYLPRDLIDVSRWDSCIDKSPNGLLYGRSLFLDTMTGHQWDALVLEDYRAVMPLCWNRKWGIRYLYHPPLTPQLGIFSPDSVTEEMITAFLGEALKHFIFAEIFLNFGNPYPGLQPFTNIVLDLTPGYDILHGRYKTDLLKNLKQSTHHLLCYRQDGDIDSAIAFYKKYYAARTPHVRPAGYRRFAEFCHLTIGHDGVIIRTIGLKDDNPHAPSRRLDREPLALALLLKYHDRLYLLMSVCPPAGRKMKANHFLLDCLVREFAASGLTLDFDGSEIPGIAHFYRNFGGDDEPFFFLRWNNLPWPLRLFKPRGTYPKNYTR
jgi:hypothetical protein